MSGIFIPKHCQKFCLGQNGDPECLCLRQLGTRRSTRHNVSRLFGDGAAGLAAIFHDQSLGFVAGKRFQRTRDHQRFACQLIAFRFALPLHVQAGASNGSGRADGLGMEDRTKCAIAFCEEVKAQGYKPGVYASTLWYRKRIDLNSLKKYTIWNAHYGVASSPIDCALWQGTCTARLPGYKGDMDVNISYIG